MDLTNQRRRVEFEVEGYTVDITDFYMTGNMTEYIYTTNSSDPNDVFCFTRDLVGALWDDWDFLAFASVQGTCMDPIQQLNATLLQVSNCYLG
jgi:hypothetical protein